VAADDEPVFGTEAVPLVAESLAREHRDALDLKDRCLAIEDVVAPPRPRVLSETHAFPFPYQPGTAASGSRAPFGRIATVGCPLPASHVGNSYRPGPGLRGEGLLKGTGHSPERLLARGLLVAGLARYAPRIRMSRCAGEDHPHELSPV
jgi:hypothetical protein